MKIIEKVEIKYFRSFADPKVEIDSLKDLNVFSGSNDSGKSNILRALNLFFNNGTTPGVGFNISNDLSKLHLERSNKLVAEKRNSTSKEVRQRDLYVDIKIYFSLPENYGGMLPRKFFVRRRWTATTNGVPNQESNIETRYKIEKGELAPNKKAVLLGQLTQFLHKIEFRYVPAVKDKPFFRHLYKELQGRLLERELSKIKSKSRDLEEVIREETRELFDEFKKSTGLDANFLLLEEDIIDFSKSVEVETDGSVYLTNRGDGIQARFIPDVLNEISKSSKKKIIVWGFEEPECSYETKNIVKLKDNFLNDYSKDKQIFITTHAREFLSLQGDNVSVYRVYKKADMSSQVAFCYSEKGFDKEQIQQSFWGDEKPTKLKKTQLEELFDDLGLIDESRRIVEYEELLKRHDKYFSKLTNEIVELKKPMVLVEDCKKELYMIAWLKLNKIDFDISNYKEQFKSKCPFLIYSAGGRTELVKKINMGKVDEFGNKMVVGVFDFDIAYSNFTGLNNGWWSRVEGRREDALFRKRIDKKNISALVIPVPEMRREYVTRNGKESHLFVEHLFGDEILKKYDHWGLKEIGGGGKVVAIKRKRKLWISAIESPDNEFSNFKLLFDRINQLLEIGN